MVDFRFLSALLIFSPVPDEKSMPSPQACRSYGYLIRNWWRQLFWDCTKLVKHGAFWKPISEQFYVFPNFWKCYYWENCRGLGKLLGVAFCSNYSRCVWFGSGILTMTDNISTRYVAFGIKGELQTWQNPRSWDMITTEATDHLVDFAQS